MPVVRAHAMKAFRQAAEGAIAATQARLSVPNVFARGSFAACILILALGLGGATAAFPRSMPRIASASLP